MTRDDILAHLAATSLLAGLPASVCEDLAREARLRSFTPGEAGRLCAMGGTDQSLWLALDSGGAGPAVQLTIGASQRGAGRLSLRMMPGELIGDIDLLLAGLAPRLAPRLATAEVMRPVQALEVPAALVARLAAEHEILRRRLIRDAAQRLRHLVGITTSDSRWPEVNFARKFLDFFEDFGTFQGNAVHLRDRMTQQAIAERMGVSLRLLAQYLTLWSRLDLINSLPVSITDFQRLDRIARIADLPAAEALADEFARLDTMFRHSAPQRAATEAADLLRIFPGNPVPLYVLARTALHNGNPDEAARLVAPLFHGEDLPDGALAGPGHLHIRVAAAWIASLKPADPEEEIAAEAAFDRMSGPLCRDLMALQARLAKDQACLETGERRSAAMARAARLYADIHLHRPDAYAALNAAGLYFLSGRPDLVQPLARAARRLATGAGYWDRVTQGEADLLLGDVEGGLARIAEASRGAGPTERASTRRQLALLAEGGLAGGKAARDMLAPGPVVAFSGAMLDLPGREPPAPGVEAAMQAALRKWMTEAPPSWLLLGLASGADILAAEEGARAGIPFEVILPFPPDHYLPVSVAPSWAERFFRCLDKATRVTVLWRGVPGAAQIERYFERANRHMLGLAQLVAHRLGASARLVTLTDNGSGSVAGTAVMSQTSEAAGVPVTALPFAGQRPARGTSAPPAAHFASVLRVLARDGHAGLEQRLRSSGLTLRRLKSQMYTAERVFPDTASALSLANTLAALPDAELLTMLCDFCPTLRANGSEDPELLRQQPSVSAMGKVILSESFVTEMLCGSATAEGFVELLLADARQSLLSGTRRYFRQADQ